MFTLYLKVFIAGKTPDKFSEELLDFLVSCIGSRGVDGKIIIF